MTLCFLLNALVNSIIIDCNFKYSFLQLVIFWGDSFILFYLVLSFERCMTLIKHLLLLLLLHISHKWPPHIFFSFYLRRYHVNVYEYCKCYGSFFLFYKKKTFELMNHYNLSIFIIFARNKKG